MRERPPVLPVRSGRTKRGRPAKGAKGQPGGEGAAPLKPFRPSRKAVQLISDASALTPVLRGAAGGRGKAGGAKTRGGAGDVGGDGDGGSDRGHAPVVHLNTRLVVLGSLLDDGEGWLSEARLLALIADHGRAQEVVALCPRLFEPMLHPSSFKRTLRKLGMDDDSRLRTNTFVEAATREMEAVEAAAAAEEAAEVACAAAEVADAAAEDGLNERFNAGVREVNRARADEAALRAEAGTMGEAGAMGEAGEAVGSRERDEEEGGGGGGGDAEELMRPIRVEDAAYGTVSVVLPMSGPAAADGLGGGGGGGGGTGLGFGRGLGVGWGGGVEGARSQFQLEATPAQGKADVPQTPDDALVRAAQGRVEYVPRRSGNDGEGGGSGGGQAAPRMLTRDMLTAGREDDTALIIACMTSLNSMAAPRMPSHPIHSKRFSPKKGKGKSPKKRHPQTVSGLSATATEHTRAGSTLSKRDEGRLLHKTIVTVAPAADYSLPLDWDPSVDRRRPRPPSTPAAVRGVGKAGL